MAPKKISRLFRLAASITLFVFTLSALWQAPAHAFFFGGASLKDEKEIGHQFHVMIRSNLPIVQDPEVSEYVRYLVERIASSIPPQPFNFHSAVILHNAMNAFAVPGGYVYVFTGLLMNFTSEDQVAGVLCHELAHVTQRHVASRIEKAQMITLGSLLLAIAGVAAGAGGAAAAASFGAGQSALLSYSRADETEADQIGMQYLIKAGYPPVGLVNGFKILRQKSWMSGTHVPTYLSTHPDIGDRITGITARIKTMPLSIQNKSFDNRRFQRMQVLLWGRYGDAQAALQRFRGSDALSLMGRGMVYSRQNNVVEAEKAFSAAVAAAPSDPLVLREAGIFEYRKGDSQKSNQLLSRATGIDPRDFMARFFLARLLDDSGRHSEAQAQFRDVLRYVPEESDVHEALARSYGGTGRQALAYIHMTYAALYAQRKDLAERYYDRAKGLSSSAPGDFQKLSTIYKERVEIWKKM